MQDKMINACGDKRNKKIKAPLNPPEGGKLPSFGGVGGGVIDVSHLPAGVYYLKIKEKAVKFVKL